MGSGYFMNGAVLEHLKYLKPDEVKQCLEALGLDYLVGVYGSDAIEDFETRSEVGAEWVRTACSRAFKDEFGEDGNWSVDVIENHGVYKVSFFK